MGRSWVPDFVFPEAAFRPLAGAGEDGDAGAVLLAALRGWDSADPSALLRLVLLVIDRCARSAGCGRHPVLVSRCTVRPLCPGCAPDSRLPNKL